MKSMKERLAPDPIMMLGGSPISVAVPPMLAAITIGSRYAAGRTPVRRAISTDIGVTKMTVVTLSAKAETVPVNHAISVWMIRGRPPARRSSRPTAQGKTPVVLSTPTTAIIAASRSRTFRSSASLAPSNEISLYGVR